MMRFIKLLLIAVGALVVLVGILGLVMSRASRPTAAASGTHAPALPAPPTAAPSAPVAVAQPELVWASAATFVRDELRSCVDLGWERHLLERVRETAKDPKAKAMPLEDLAADEVRVELLGGNTMLDDVLKPRGGTGEFLVAAQAKEVTPLRQSCAKQFPTRKALATCIVALSNTKHSLGQLRLAIYSALANDRAMRECVAVGGEWAEVDRDSLEFRSARSRELIRRAAEHEEQN